MKDCICIESVDTGGRRRIEGPVWVLRQPNGVLVRCHRVKAQGVGDGADIWALEGKGLEGYEAVRPIPLAEYLSGQGEAETDPELTDAQALDIILGGNHEAE